MNKKIIQDLLVGLVIAVLSIALTYWLNWRHSQPLIEIDSGNALYSRINNTPIGTIFVGNSGYKTDRDISITIDDNIEKNNVNIPGLIGDYNVKPIPNGTVITIKELRPSESVQIFFSPSDKTVDYFNILDVVSESNNIYYLYYTDWWTISFELKILFGFLILLALFLGWYISNRVFLKKRGR